MLAKRIIPCLDVKEGFVVKGVKFKSHKIIAEILPLAKLYSDMGADELVFYDITASCDNKIVDYRWVEQVASTINIPFSVAGGISSVKQAEKILESGADKISINSPAIARPDLISELAKNFGSQCVVVGVDSKKINGQYLIHQYTGRECTTLTTSCYTQDWLNEIESRGAGEIVLNCMDADGTHNGFDLEHILFLQEVTHLPLIASGGAGNCQHFLELFKKTTVSGALAASIFHSGQLSITELKKYLAGNNVEVRNDD